MTETNPSSKTSKDYTLEFFIAGGYILLFCLVIYVLTFFFLWVSFPKDDQSINIIATNLPSRNPTPSILPTSLSDEAIIFKDEFSDDKNKWTQSIKKDVLAEIKDGKLILQLRDEESFGEIKCELCPDMQEPYYLEADLSTTKDTNQNFGLIFHYDNVLDDFYVLTINTETQQYKLFHQNYSGWALKIGGYSNFIRSYPDHNTIGILTRNDTVEIYINSQIVDSYKSTGEFFQDGYFGFYVTNTGFELSVDNLKVYKIGR